MDGRRTRWALLLVSAIVALSPAALPAQGGRSTQAIVTIHADVFPCTRLSVADGAVLIRSNQPWTLSAVGPAGELFRWNGGPGSHGIVIPPGSSVVTAIAD